MIGFVGFGRMGSALAQGAVSAGVVQGSQVIAYDPDHHARATLKKLGGRSAANATEVLAKADFIFLCVKPQMMEVVLGEFQGDPLVHKRCFVSIAAGITLGKLQETLGKKVSIFRVMPNTPALLAAGMSAVSCGRFGTSRQEARIRTILSSVGRVARVPERFMDVVTAVSGSGPAYVFYLAEALIQAARALGLPKQLARELVHQTIYGGGLMLAKRPESAEELRRQVTSPGGTTAAAMAFFDSQDLKRLIYDAVERAAERSAELANN